MLEHHQRNDCKKRSVECSFCGAQVTTSDIRGHLLSCGNKTELCNRCNRYILRAIFTYHCENNCHNPDEENEEPSPPPPVPARATTATTHRQNEIDSPIDNRKFERIARPTIFDSDKENESQMSQSLKNRINESIQERTFDRTLRSDIFNDNGRPQSSHSSRHHHDRGGRSSEYDTRAMEYPMNNTNFQIDSSGKILGISSNKQQQRNDTRPNDGRNDQEQTITCEFCNQLCAFADYEHHKKYCLQNRKIKMNDRKRTYTDQDRNNGATSIEDDVQIPCEFCNEPVSLQELMNHTRRCADLDRKHIRDRLRDIENEPVTEKMPCEFCEKQVDAKELNIHEMDCAKNPRIIAYEEQRKQRSNKRPDPTKIPKSSTSQDANSSVLLSDLASRYPRSNSRDQLSVRAHDTKSEDLINRINAVNQRSDSSKNNRAQYLSIDIDRTKEANEHIRTTTTRNLPHDTYGSGSHLVRPSSRENLSRKYDTDERNGHHRPLTSLDNNRHHSPAYTSLPFRPSSADHLSQDTVSSRFKPIEPDTDYLSHSKNKNDTKRSQETSFPIGDYSSGYDRSASSTLRRTGSGNGLLNNRSNEYLNGRASLPLEVRNSAFKNVQDRNGIAANNNTSKTSLYNPDNFSSNTRRNINDSRFIKTNTLVRADHSIEYQSLPVDRPRNKESK
ncbi:unnamed protein product [Didymodactylos carnosus]|uniref:Uncharacterized protein n=2 Tax=Didymodactylos carnosus TaxID=1234261 RepID=A0A8S2CVV2_9BILA|nr:unnamed protein product [Didymodactylos carnosus]CAF3526427.1 unnamed protein product [Didymodactylos carnosus]